MNTYSNARDRTHQQPARGEGIPPLLLFMCNHKGGRTGAEMRGRIPMRCAACVAKGRASNV
jgi:hypothetical protein